MYEEYCRQKSDINEHLPILKRLAAQCRHITEFGFRTGISTVALIAAEPEKVITYDIDPSCLQTYKILKPYADSLGVELEFHVTDTGTLIAPETDMLFIDTWHNAIQIEKELLFSGNRAKKFIAFHDTVTFGVVGEKGGEGILRPINQFLENNKHWKVKHEYFNNNGLLVIVRKGGD